MKKSIEVVILFVIVFVVFALPFSSALTVYYPSSDTNSKWYENESQAIFVNTGGYPQDIYNSSFTLGTLSIAINVTRIVTDVSTPSYDVLFINVAGLGVAFDSAENSAITPQFIEIGAYMSPSNNGANPLGSINIIDYGYGTNYYGTGINVSQPSSNSFVNSPAYELTAALAATAADAILPWGGLAVSAAFIAYHQLVSPPSFHSSKETTGTQVNWAKFNVNLNNVFPPQNFSYLAQTTFEWYIPYNLTQNIYTLTLFAETGYSFASYYTLTSTVYDNLTISPPPPPGTHGGGSCVYGLEPVLMANGVYKLAKDIKVGDQVMTYNFTIDSPQIGNVTNISITKESEMYIINGVLYLAPDQNVWTERGWVMADNLTYNDTIYNVFTNTWDYVNSIVIVNGTFHMYDFSIDVNGNYIAFAYIMEDKCLA